MLFLAFHVIAFAFGFIHRAFWSCYIIVVEFNMITWDFLMVSSETKSTQIHLRITGMLLRLVLCFLPVSLANLVWDLNKKDGLEPEDEFLPSSCKQSHLFLNVVISRNGFAQSSSVYIFLHTHVYTLQCSAKLES